MTLEECFDQGFRCGHIEGRGADLDCSATVNGEHVNADSWEAAKAQSLESTAHEAQWAAGYRCGYFISMHSEPLPVRFR